ncbi:MAG TPA: FHA domain-containing protein [Streptosporangiaceae bacterium]|nr:FHA domain-containing protein [Streptosporangiaceae bacterium]
MTPESAHSPAGSVLIVRTPDAERSLAAGRSYYIGRDPQSDIVVNDSRVSWRHAVLRQDGGNWLLEDVGSTNGTFKGRDRVQRVAISGSCAVRLGHPDDGPAMSCSVAAPERQADGAQAGRGAPTRYAESPAAPPAPPPNPAVNRVAGDVGYAGAAPAGGRAAAQQGAGYAGAAPAGADYAGAPPGSGYGAPHGGYGDGAPGGVAPAGPPVPRPRSSMERMPSAVLRLPTTLLRIGRAQDNQVVIADLSVSRYHAELRRNPRGGYTIVDLGSHNGTFVNGQRVESAPVTERDIINIGPATYRLVGEELQEFLDTGEISFIAKDLTVTLPSGRTLLDHVSFPLGERCFMGVIGPSGAGKSTLLGALTGTAPATSGQVLYDGRDLYTNYAQLRHRIGLVPQENILHTQLTARRGLGYAAELRFPRDTSKAERSHRIDEVLEELALTRHADTKTAAMSGGQQKRVNVALELLTKPSLLFLDEPTSGLDPGLDKSVMEQMRDLAHDGRTVIVVTHSVANLNLCDQLLVLVPGGKIAYFGPPQEGLRHFNQPGWAEVFQAFESEPNRDWAGEYRNSVYYQQYVATGMENPVAIQGRGSLTAAAPKTSNRFAQMSTLVRRYSAVIASDRGFLYLLVGVVFGLGALVRAFPLPNGGFVGPNNDGAQSALLILVLCACFSGALNAIREIVKERPIYARERGTGLSPGAYLASKVIVLGVISAFQAILLVAIGLAGKNFPPKGSVLPIPLLEVAIAIAAVAVVSMVIGLFTSSMVSTAERAMPLVFLLVMIQVVTTGGIFAIHGTAGLEQIAWFTPSRWGFAAAASTVDLNVIAPKGSTIDPLWDHTSHAWLMDIGAMVALLLFYSALTWWRLLKLGPLKRGA